jgi:Fatty acid hydroxylase superfamily
MFIHSNLKWRLGPLAYVFVGPEMHRWHHAVDRDRRECNYGNNFSIFDWLFGTAYLTHEEPARFGVEDPEYPEGQLLKQFFYAFRPTDATAVSSVSTGTMSAVEVRRTSGTAGETQDVVRERTACADGRV